MRADEEANIDEIERDSRFRNTLKKGVGTAATIATAIPVVGAAAKVIPWLSKYIPKDLAMKALNKVSPGVANFLKRGESMGLNVEEGMQYVKDQISPTKKEESNIIEQYSPELFSFMDQEIKKGTSLAKASSEASKKYKDIINRIEKDHKTSWIDILEKVFGKETSRQMGLKKFNEKKGLAQEETERFENQYGKQSQGLDPEVAQILQQGNAIINKFRGQ